MKDEKRRRRWYFSTLRRMRKESHSCVRYIYVCSTIRVSNGMSANLNENENAKLSKEKSKKQNENGKRSRGKWISTEHMIECSMKNRNREKRIWKSIEHFSIAIRISKFSEWTKERKWRFFVYFLLLLLLSFSFIWVESISLFFLLDMCVYVCASINIKILKMLENSIEKVLIRTSWLLRSVDFVLRSPFPFVLFIFGTFRLLFRRLIFCSF